MGPPYLSWKDVLRRRKSLSLPQTEEEYADMILAILQAHPAGFTVEREVWGKHISGRNLRIDAVIRPKNASEWRNQQIAFGVEFKLPKPGKATREYTYWLRQCVDYRYTKWQGYGGLYIFLCPGLAFKFHEYQDCIFVTKDQDYVRPFTQSDGAASWLAHVVGPMGIGEIKDHKHNGWSLVLNAERLWSEQRGVEAGSRQKLNYDVGSK